MKYEQQLLFNAQSEWTDYYIAYSTLKSAVYKAEKEALQYRLGSNDGAGDEEQGGLLAHTDGNQDTTSSEILSNKFRALCDAELAKIEAFYKDKEKELLEQLDAIKEEVQQVEEEGAFGEMDDESGEDESGESGDEDAGLMKRGSNYIKSALGSTSKKRDSSEDERGVGSSQGTGMPRRRSSSIPTKSRKRSQGASDGSEGGSSTFDSLQRVVTPSDLPAEAVEDIDAQLDRTVQAATAGNPSLSNKPLPSPRMEPASPYGTATRTRRRASSFGAGRAGGSTNDIWSSNSRHAIDMRITFKLRLQSLFRDLSQLKEYVSLNQSRSSLDCLKPYKILTSPICSWFQEDSEEV